jgi:hypothetical protein
MHPNVEDSSASPKATALGPLQEDQEHDDQKNEIGVSAELLNSLLAKMNRLDDTVLKLQNEISSVKHDLSTLCQNCGGDFILFPKFPPELRR